MSVILQSINLTKRFTGVIANEDVNFDLHVGEVHCLFGENGAGKSTLSSCFFGFYQPDGGHIEFNGKPVRFTSPRDAIAMGIGMVHQHFVLVEDFTVLENIVVGTHGSGWRLGLADARRRVVKLCRDYEINLDPDALIRDLTVGEQQWVEILKALYLEARVLILDEPTAVLTPAESARLFRIMDHMRVRGLSIILISHKMSEVMQADRVTVLRRGRVVGTAIPQDVTPQVLTNMMVGRDVELRIVRDRKKQTPVKAVPVLVVEGVNYRDTKGKAALADISLRIHEGEILGLAGVSGNGQKELFEALSGVLTPQTGSISLAGEEMRGRPSRHYMDRGVGLIPDDRFREGLIADFDIRENMLLGWQRDDSYTNGPFMDQTKIAAMADALVEQFQIKAPSGSTPVNHLSGGNAQKVILARELMHSSKLLLANQPTRGLDLGVIEYVYRQIIAKRDEGYAVLLASEELEDLLNLCDRIAVMAGGRITGIVDPQSTSIEEIGLLMAGGTATAAAREAI